MKATIRDVARQAGVSVATVSRVFNDSGPVSPDTRRRIRDVARDLRYTPNSAARSLSVKRNHTLGALLPDLHGEFFSEVIRGMDETAQRHHHHLLISSSHNDRAQIAAALRVMRGRVDGLLLMSPGVDAETLTAELPDGLPVVLLNCPVREARYATLATAAAAGRLIVLGLRPEQLSLSDALAVQPPDGDSMATLSLHLDAVEPLGNEILLYGRAGSQELTARVAPMAMPPSPGETVTLAVDTAGAHLFDAESGERIGDDAALVSA